MILYYIYIMYYKKPILPSRFHPDQLVLPLPQHVQLAAG